MFARYNEATQEPKPQSSSFLRRPVLSLVDRLAAILNQCAVGPTQTWHVVFHPCSEVDTANAGYEYVPIAVPHAEDALILFARADRPSTFVAFMRLARARSRSAICRRRVVIITGAIVAHSRSLPASVMLYFPPCTARRNPLYTRPR